MRPTLKTGDIVLFSGDSIAEKAIRRATASAWSHVGLVVRIHNPNVVCLWESTMLNVARDVDRKRIVKGVSLVSLSERVMRTKGNIAVRQSLEPMDEVLKNRLVELRRLRSATPYEFLPSELIGAAFDVPCFRRYAAIRHAWLGSAARFCSELVAEAFITIGWLPDGKNINYTSPFRFAPCDFEPFRKMDTLQKKAGIPPTHESVLRWLAHKTMPT